MWWAPRGLGQGMAACRPVRPSEVLSAVTERGEGEADRPTAATALNAGVKPRGGVGSIISTTSLIPTAFSAGFALNE
jgi:hypothetical protein